MSPGTKTSKTWALVIEDDPTIVIALKNNWEHCWKKYKSEEAPQLATATSFSQAADIITKIQEKGDDVSLLISDFITGGTIKSKEFLIIFQSVYSQAQIIIITGNDSDAIQYHLAEVIERSNIQILEKPVGLKRVFEAID